MTTYLGSGFLTDPVSTSATPYWVVTIIIKDHNGHDIKQSEFGGGPSAPTIQFLITNGGGGGSGFSAAFVLPSINNDAGGASTVAAPTNTALLAALKAWAANMDWNTGYDWSNTSTSSGATVTPVSFDSINITEVTGTELTGSDITPS